MVWQPSREWKKSFYWLRWEDPWLGATLTATVDREANRIDLSVQAPAMMLPSKARAARPRKVATIGVHLDGRLVDLGRDVVITLDGEERYRGMPEASLATLLRTAEEREDPDYVFARLARLTRPK